MAVTRNIIWRKAAALYLEKAIDYIRQDSVKNADIVAKAILTSIDKASRFPEHFPPDKYKHNNTGSSGLLKFIVSEFRFLQMLKQSELYG